MLTPSSPLFLQGNWFHQLGAHVGRLHKGKKGGDGIKHAVNRQLNSPFRIKNSIDRSIRLKASHRWLTAMSSCATGKPFSLLIEPRSESSRSPFQPRHQSLLDWEVCPRWLSVSKERLPLAVSHQWSSFLRRQLSLPSWFEPFCEFRSTSYHHIHHLIWLLASGADARQVRVAAR